MERLLTAPTTEEATEGCPKVAELFEVVVVRDFAPEPLPHRLDRIQVGAVGRQEAEPHAWVGAEERDEAGAAMPGRPIEDDDDQHGRIGVEQLTQESSEVGRREARSQPPMEASRHDVQGAEAVDLLMGARPVPGRRLLAGEAPLSAERGGELNGDLVLEEHSQAVRQPMRETQEPADVSFFSRRRQAGTAGS